MKTGVKSIFLLILVNTPVTVYGNANIPTADKLIPVKAGQVKIGGEIGRRIDITIQNNLLAFDIEKAFLLPFREKTSHRGNSGLNRYIGLGKLIDAVVHFAAYTNDEKIIAVKNHLVDETIKTQLPDGYIGIFQPEDRIKAYWDVHEMVYIVYGLVSDYRKFGNKSSLQAAQKLADYIMQNRPVKPVIHKTVKLNLERAFIALFRATGRQQYLDYCADGVDGMSLRNWHQPVERHAYTFMNLCLAQLDLYRIEPDEKLLAQSRHVIDYITTNDGLLISGTVSRAEGWHSNQEGSGRIGETCSTVYLVYLMSHMLRIEGNSFYGDIMERAIYNSLFAAQSPDGRHLRYFCPFEGKRKYFETRWQGSKQLMTRISEDTYCCPNNFRRIIARLDSMIYYRADDGLAINLYTQSSATVKLKDDLSLKVRQETDYPNSGKVVIHIDPSRPAQFPLHLRIPRWCENVQVVVNGQTFEQNIQSGCFFTMEKQFEKGDQIEVVMPMKWRFIKGRKKQTGLVALMRGPLLFCLNPTRNGARQEADLQTVRIDPSSLLGPVKDEIIRPNGLACYVRAWSDGRDSTEPADLRLMLTEFADPGGEAVYFRTSYPAVDDKLVQLKSIAK
ncbi:MAG: beta-L-arabinofuranosidase domain-containing protein [Planctomycetota bacterium]|jgi:DUF1680 family protein